MKVLLLGLLAFGSISAFSQSEEGAQICRNVGQAIANAAEAQVETRHDYVFFNDLSSQKRLELLHMLRYEAGIYNRDLLLEKLSTSKSLSREDAKRIIYKDTTKIISSWFSGIPSFLLNSFSLSRAITISEPLTKLVGSSYQGSQLISATWVDVYSNIKYVKPLLNLVERLIQNVLTKSVTKSNIYNDLLQSFQDHGMNVEEATQMTWNILGLYGSHGASLHHFSIPFDKNYTGVGVALAYLSYLVSVVDSVNLENGGNIYSLPPRFKTQCAIGKPYHFWMSAFLSYKLKMENDSGAISASYTLGELYEFFVETNGRQGKEYSRSQELVKMKLDNLEIQSIRLSLVLHAAGSVFGARFKDSNVKVKDLDYILGSALKKSKLPKFLSLTDDLNFYNPFMRHSNLQSMTGSQWIYDQVTGN